MGDKDAPRTPRGTLTTVRARAGYQIHQDPAGSAKHPRFIPHATVRAIATEEHQTSWDWTDLPGVIVHKITKSVWLKRKPFQQSPTRNKWYCSKEPWWPIFIQMTFCPFMLKWNVCVCIFACIFTSSCPDLQFGRFKPQLKPRTRVWIPATILFSC